MEIRNKIVDFEKYCKKCKYWSLDESQDPCNDCLNNPMNTDSRKPVNFEEKEK